MGWLRLGVLLGLSALVAGVTPTGATSGSVFPYPIRTVEFENGLKLVMVEMPTPGVVNFRTVVRTGSRNELEPGHSGYAHFFEHMMFRGTPNVSEEEYETIKAELGSDDNASTGEDLTNYYLTFPASAVEQVIDLEADRFRNLSYTREQFRKEAGAILGEFMLSRSDPWSMRAERRLELAFSIHPYGHTVIGREEDVRAMPDGYDYSLEFYERYYKPEYCVILVAGDIDPGAIERKVRAAFGEWERGNFVPDFPVEPPLAGPLRDELVWDGPTRPTLEVSFRTPAYSDTGPTTAALELIAELYFGRTSALYRELVDEKGLIESIRASFDRTRDPYLFTVTARLRNAADFDFVERRIDETLADAQDVAIDAGALEAAQRRSLASLALMLETPGGVGWRLTEFISLTGDARSLDRHYANLAAVTPVDLQNAARRYLVDEGSIRLQMTGREEVQ